MKNSTYCFLILLISIIINSCSSFTGKKKFNWDTETIAAQIEYKDGKPVGVWSFYYPDGKPFKTITYKDGIPKTETFFSYGTDKSWGKKNNLKKGTSAKVYYDVKSSERYMNEKKWESVSKIDFFADENLILQYIYNHHKLDSIIVHNHSYFYRSSFSKYITPGVNKGLLITDEFIESHEAMEELVHLLTNDEIASKETLEKSMNENNTFLVYTNYDIKKNAISSKLKNGGKNESGFFDPGCDGAIGSKVDDFYNDCFFSRPEQNLMHWGYDGLNISAEEINQIKVKIKSKPYNNKKDLKVYYNNNNTNVNIIISL
tara:strand:+ start:552 stop:1499 length:948 start_codon:yes stop_codon:yes gene_type:complete